MKATPPPEDTASTNLSAKRTSVVTSRQNGAILAAILFLFTLAIYWPSYRAGYIWDDDMLAENPLVNSGWPGLKTIWTSTKYPDFCPLTATSFWLEAQLGGATAAVRHTTNIFLQGFNVVLVWLILRCLKIPGAWIAAMIFAAHPLCVTSVTWVAERKNTLSIFFYLSSFLFFLRGNDFDQEERADKAVRTPRFWFLFSFLCYIAALLSKTSTVVLPVVLLLCAWWRTGKIFRADLWRVSPYFGIAFAAGLTTLIAHSLFGDKNIVYDNLLLRVLAGTKAVWFYLSKALVPLNLTMHYPRWESDPQSLTSYLPGLGIIATFTICWRFRNGWGKAALFGLGYFLIALAPALGIAKMTFLRFSQVADHFQFLALPGLIALVVGGICHLVERKNHGIRTIYITQTILLLTVVPVLTVLSLKHQRIIGNAENLWTDNLKKNPQSWIAHYGMTSILEARGQLRDVEAHYRQAIEIRPDYLDALSNLGVLLARQGRWFEAIECYQRALSFDPSAAMIHFNLGTAFLSQNRFIEAVGPLSKAVELNPSYSKFHNNLASALMKTGRQDEAFQRAREAIRLDPTNDEAQADLGLMLFQNGKTGEAIQQFQNALQFNPKNVRAHYRLATAFVTLNRNDEALRHLSIALQLQPDNLLARTSLAELFKRQGRSNEATAQQAAISFLRGRELLNKNQISEAKESFRQALKLDGTATVLLAGEVCTASTPNAFGQLDLLASICAEERQTTHAITILQKIITFAESAGQANLAAKYRGHLQDYRQRSGQ